MHNREKWLCFEMPRSSDASREKFSPRSTPDLHLLGLYKKPTCKTRITIAFIFLHGKRNGTGKKTC